MSDEPILVDFRGLQRMGWGYSKTHTYRLTDKGRFPKPFKLGYGKRSRNWWRVAEVKPYLKGEVSGDC